MIACRHATNPACPSFGAETAKANWRRPNDHIYTPSAGVQGFPRRVIRKPLHCPPTPPTDGEL